MSLPIQRLLAAGVVSAVFVAAHSFAQQKPPAPPALPPINPAVARLDFTIEGIGCPGFAIGRSEEMDGVAAGFEDGAIRYWEKGSLATGMVKDRPGAVFKVHQGPVTALAWNGGPILASAGADQKIVLLSMPAGKPAQTLPAGSIVRALAMAPDGKRAAGSLDDFSIQLVDVPGGKLANKLAGHTNWVLALAFNADGKQLASGGYEGKVFIWDVDGGKKMSEIVVKPATPPPDPKAPPPPPLTVTAVAFSPDGKTLAAGTADGQIFLFNPADGKLIRPLPGHTAVITSLIFHPNNTLLVSGSKDRSIRLWNLAAGQPFKVLEGHTAWVDGVSLMSQGTRLASVGADQTVRVWDMTEPAKKK
jgi:WD40 repeat protein